MATGRLKRGGSRLRVPFRIYDERTTARDDAKDRWRFHVQVASAK